MKNLMGMVPPPQIVGDEMKQKIGQSVAKASNYANVRRNEVCWSIVGVTVGAIAGSAVGGVGIATAGSATGVPRLVVLLVLAVVGGLIGNRVGIWIDRRTGR